MEQKEFTSISGRQYREKTTSIIELMSMVDYYDSDDFAKVTAMNSFALEHLEVNIKGVWVQVKAKGRDTFTPVDIAEDVEELKDLISWYLENVMKPVFQKSVESMKKRRELADKK